MEMCGWILYIYQRMGGQQQKIITQQNYLYYPPISGGFVFFSFIPTNCALLNFGSVCSMNFVEHIYIMYRMCGCHGKWENKNSL